MGNWDRKSIEDGSNEGKVLSAVYWNHGGLSLLPVQGSEDVQEGDGRLQSTNDIRSVHLVL